MSTNRFRRYRRCRRSRVSKGDFPGFHRKDRPLVRSESRSSIRSVRISNTAAVVSGSIPPAHQPRSSTDKSASCSPGIFPTG